jgi:hypothetical protein
MLPSVGLRDHHRERMSDGVVHLADDPGPFCQYREPGPLVTLDLQQPDPFGQCLGLGASYRL